MPIIVGGHSELAARRAGRIGDGFFPATGWAGNKNSLFTIMSDEAKRHGRDPDKILRTTGLNEEDPLESSLKLAEKGFDRVVVNSALFKKDPKGEIERFRDEVIGPFNERV